MQQSQQYEEELAQGVTASLTDDSLQQQDALAVAQNGGLTGSTAEDAEMADAEGDDGMDDDMMDKISSSPSIDDGGYSFPLMWPQRSDSLSCDMITTSSPSFTQACCESSSPFVETPDHYPLRLLHDQVGNDLVVEVQANMLHHHLGEYLDDADHDQNFHQHCYSLQKSVLSTDGIRQHVERDGQDWDLGHLPQELLAGPIDLEGFSINSEDDAYMIPYELSDDENDDDYDFPYTADARYVDSGWGGECLQELEDIDFEFVYALHTFVATVEGQANATKGDTMVLLDDSNSYWWLVRVVKDSSIGESNMWI